MPPLEKVCDNDVLEVESLLVATDLAKGLVASLLEEVEYDVATEYLDSMASTDHT
jgi:hypothetical protein